MINDISSFMRVVYGKPVGVGYASLCPIMFPRHIESF